MIGENKDCKSSKTFVKKGLFKRTRGEVSTVHRKKDVPVEYLYNYINVRIKNIRFLQTFAVILSQCDVVFTHLANDCWHFHQRGGTFEKKQQGANDIKD